jgi:hypothetical protein
MSALAARAPAAERRSEPLSALASGCEDLNAYLKALKTLSDQELSLEWQAMHRALPPRLSRRFLLLGIGYKYQELQAGKPLQALLREARRRTSRLQEGYLHPGTKLVREWQGATYRVDVLEDGFRLGERTYASLSAVAREITGVNRSGPLFFGLREPS